jgi:opacity protein-like surface antigen
MRRTHALAAAAALTLGLATQARAQTEIGVKAGLTFATISESNLSPNFENKTGFVAGVHFGFPLGKNFMLQPEALITQQGAGVANTDDEISLNYLTIPLNLRLNFGSGNVRPFILAGPYAAFKLSCDIDDTFDDDCDNDISGTDWGFDFGGGIKFSKIFIEARYNLGLQDVSSLELDSKQRVFMVMVGFAF